MASEQALVLSFQVALEFKILACCTYWAKGLMSSLFGVAIERIHRIKCFILSLLSIRVTNFRITLAASPVNQGHKFALLVSFALVWAHLCHLLFFFSVHPVGQRVIEILLAKHLLRDLVSEDLFVSHLLLKFLLNCHLLWLG